MNEVLIIIAFSALVAVIIGAILYSLMKSIKEERKPKHELVGTQWVMKRSNPFCRPVYIVEDVRENWVSLCCCSNGYEFPCTLPISLLKLNYKELT